MAPADAERLLSNRVGRLTEASWEFALPALQELARSAFRVTDSNHELTPQNPSVTLDLPKDIQIQIPFQGTATGSVAIECVLLNRLPAGHRQFLSVQDHYHHKLSEQLCDASHRTISVAVAAQPLPAELPPAFGEFIKLGIKHIATGYDHLLFLLGLLIIGTTLKAALKIITSFTLAHSVTLALATLNLLNIPPRIIEPLIAASIVFVGVQNLLCRDVEKRWLLTFGFGLIHGCGFASALRDLGVGANGSGVAVPLLSFNLGVELGQLSIAALVLPAIWKFQTAPLFVRRFVPCCSAVIVLLGGYWLLQRTIL
jgi:hydrogenase/urease accessory protein HupE